MDPQILPEDLDPTKTEHTPKVIVTRLQNWGTNLDLKLSQFKGVAEELNCVGYYCPMYKNLLHLLYKLSVYHPRKK
jgi:hypothetical protein